MKRKAGIIAVIGLGYVGLPIALEFARKKPVIGFDINEEKLDLMRRHVDPSGELSQDKFDGCNIIFTSDLKELAKADFYIVAVPTPIDSANQPDLKPVIGATKSVGKVLKKGDYVVYESTVYPGCTEEDCIPLLEKLSGLKFKTDFKVGYSPERINPGDKNHTLTNTKKIVSGCDEETLEKIAETYSLIIQPGVYKASCIKVAEAAKIIENIQRDVNIALMNELSIIFGRMGINTFEVLEAAGTKWNFLKFFPGLVGGHCIGVDPYYMVHKAQKLKYHPQIINAGRFVNDSMGGYIAKKLVKELIKTGRSILNSRVLVLGITFKENVSDIRNSKVVDIVKELQDYGVKVDVADPDADSAHVKVEYGIEMIPNERTAVETLCGDGEFVSDTKYDAVVVAVSHNQYMDIPVERFLKITNANPVFVDVKGTYRGKVPGMRYWSL